MMMMITTTTGSNGNNNLLSPLFMCPLVDGPDTLAHTPTPTHTLALRQINWLARLAAGAVAGRRTRETETETKKKREREGLVKLKPEIGLFSS